MSRRSSLRNRRPKNVLINQSYDREHDKPNTSDWYYVLEDTPKLGPTNVLVNTSKIPDVTPGRKRDSKWYTHLEDTRRMSYKSRENSKDVSSSLSNVSSLSENEPSVRGAPVRSRYPLRKAKGRKSIDPIEYQSALGEKSIKLALRSNKSQLSELVENVDSSDNSNALINPILKKKLFQKQKKNRVSKLASDFQSVFDKTGNPTPPVATQQPIHNVSSDENSSIISGSEETNKKALFKKKKQRQQSVRVMSTKFQEALDDSDKNKKRKVDSLQEQCLNNTPTLNPSPSLNQQNISNIASDESSSALKQYGKQGKTRLFKRSRQEHSTNPDTFQQALESDKHHEIFSKPESAVKTSDSSHQSTPDGHSLVGKKKLFKRKGRLAQSVSAGKPSAFQEALNTENVTSRVLNAKTGSSKFSDDGLVVKRKSTGDVSEKSSVEYTKPGPFSKKHKESLGGNPNRFLEVAHGTSNDGSVANSENKATMQANDGSRDSHEDSPVAAKKRLLREKKQGNIAVFANDFQAALDVDDDSASINSSKLESGPKSISNRFSTSPDVPEGHTKKILLKIKNTTFSAVNPSDFQNALDESEHGEISLSSKTVQQDKSVSNIKATLDTGIQNSKTTTTPLSTSSQQQNPGNSTNLRSDSENVSSILVTSSSSSTMFTTQSSHSKKNQRPIPGNVPETHNALGLPVGVDDNSSNSTFTKPGPLSRKFHKRNLIDPSDFQEALDVDENMVNVSSHKSLVQSASSSDLVFTKLGLLSKKMQEQLPNEALRVDGKNAVDTSGHESLDKSSGTSLNSTFTKPGPLSKKVHKRKPIDPSDFQTALDVDENMVNVSSHKSLVQSPSSSDLMFTKLESLSKKVQEQVPNEALHVDGKNAMDTSSHESLDKSAGTSLSSTYTRPGPLSKKGQMRNSIVPSAFQASLNYSSNQADNTFPAFEKSVSLFDKLLQGKNTRSTGFSVQKKKEENQVNLSSESTETKISKSFLNVVDDDTLIFNPQANSTRYYPTTPKTNKPSSTVSQNTYDKVSEVGLKQLNPSVVLRRLSQRAVAGESGTNQADTEKSTENDNGAISQSRGNDAKNSEILKKSEAVATTSNMLTQSFREQTFAEMGVSKNRVSIIRHNPNPKETYSKLEANRSISSVSVLSSFIDRNSLDSVAMYATNSDLTKQTPIGKSVTTGFDRSIEALKIMAKRSSGEPTISIPLVNLVSSEEQVQSSSHRVHNVDKKQHVQSGLLHESELNENEELISEKINQYHSSKELTKSVSSIKPEQAIDTPARVLISTSRNSGVSTRDDSVGRRTVSLVQNNTSAVDASSFANKEGIVSRMHSFSEDLSTARDVGNQREKLEEIDGSNSSMFESLEEDKADSLEGGDIQMFNKELENDALRLGYKVPLIPVITSEKNLSTSMKRKLSELQEVDANSEQRTHGDVSRFNNLEMDGETVPELMNSVTTNAEKRVSNVSDRGRSTTMKDSRQSRHSRETQREQKKKTKELNAYKWALGSTRDIDLKRQKFQSISEFMAEANLRNKNCEAEFQKEDDRLKKMVRSFKTIHPAQSQITNFFNPAPRSVVAKLNKPKPPPKPVDPDFLVNGKFYRPPKLVRPSRWCTDRLYNIVMKKTKERYGELKMRRKAEEFIRALSQSVCLAMRCKKNFEPHVNEAKMLLYKMGIIKTTMDFYVFIHDFMPRDFRRQAIPTQRAYGVMSGPKFDPNLDIFEEIRL